MLKFNQIWQDDISVKIFLKCLSIGAFKRYYREPIETKNQKLAGQKNVGPKNWQVLRKLEGMASWLQHRGWRNSMTLMMGVT